IDKANNAAGTIRLNYLVNGATWRPQYKLRAGGEKAAVQVEYLAAIQQQAGEDWNDVSVVLSTAEPMLSAAPPELVAMDVTISGRGAGDKGNSLGLTLGGDNFEQQRALRRQAMSLMNSNDYARGNTVINGAGALQQTEELFGAAMPQQQTKSDLAISSASLSVTSTDSPQR